MFKKIDHVEIIPRDLDKSIEFYCDVLFFELKSRFNVEAPPLKEIAYLELGGTIIELMSVEGDKNHCQDEWKLGYRCIALEVDNMQEAIEYLKSKSVSIHKEPVDLGSSIRAEIKDIDGFLIELREWRNK